MPEEWTPTTAQVRDGYAADPEAEYRDPINYPAWERSLGQAFDRWLAARDRENQAIGWDEGWDRGVEYERWGESVSTANPHRGDTR